MSVFTHYGPKSITSEINPETLKHSYFVQRTPVGKGLVPGVLHQGKRPPTGKWEDITTLPEEFQDRYFVQYTDFNTLVPGSLMQSDKLPEGRWKEIKKLTDKLFHRIVFSSPVYSVGTIVSETEYTTHAEFVSDKFVPVLEAIWPGITSTAVSAYMNYFQGDFAELGGDASKLIQFAYPGVYFKNLIGNFDPLYGSLMSSNLSSAIQMRVNPITPAGTYSFAFYIPRNEHGRIVYHYVVLENIFIKS
jgi:hypothetical protein